jgi:predicted esterase
MGRRHRIGSITGSVGLVIPVAMIATCAASPGVAAQEPPAVLWHEARALFPLRVHLPAGYDSTRAYPTVIALHGYGGSSEAFGRIGRVFAEAGFIAVLPDGPYPVPYLTADSTRHSSWDLTTWTRALGLGPPLTEDPAIEARSTGLTAWHFIPRVIDRVQEQYRVGPLFAFGFSLGGVYALGGAFYNRDRFDGVAVFGVAEIEREWFENRGETMEDGRDLPVRLAVGNSDRYLTTAEAERARDLFREAGYDVTLDIFEGGHSVPDEPLGRAAEWLRGLADVRETEGRIQ